MNRAFIAAAAAALAFAPVTALTAPPAGADDDSVAVAINPKTQAMSDSYGSDSASALEKTALANCNRDHGPCELVASTTEGCIGIALGNPPQYAYAIVNLTGFGSTPVAEATADEKLAGGGNRDAAACSDGGSDGFS
jgi:Domain of unknown function (DUF4189)